MNLLIARSMNVVRSTALILTALACTATGHAQDNMTSWVHPDGTRHWYMPVAVPGGITWQQASLAAARAGGYLASITSAAESDRLTFLAARLDMWSYDATTKRWNGPWIGGRQGSNGREPAGGFRWSELEPMRYTNWAPGEPNNNVNADAVHLSIADVFSMTWADAPSNAKMPGYIVEFSGAFARRTVGVTHREARGHDGLVLLSPTTSRATYLIDRYGRVVHVWTSQYIPGQSAYLLPNGNLLRCGKINNSAAPGLGNGGIVEEFDWNNNLVWSFTLNSSTQMLHHDVERLPNGNTLMIVWIRKTKAEAIAAGRDPKLIPDGDVWPDKIIEVKKTGKTTGQIVWEWSAWDHLVQDFDRTKANFGDPAKHPELIDINYSSGLSPDGERDWLHPNAVAYNATLDQIVMSVRNNDELWIIDHSTTTAQAAGHTGGRSGKGGDLLYRWGNPQTYRAGTSTDRKLFGQHNTHWIPSGRPGAGNILIYNNGEQGTREYSTVVEITPPAVDSKGNYSRPNAAFGPAKPTWTYQAKNPFDFYSPFISGAERLKNGNTIICAGWIGRTFEITPQGDIVWEYGCPAGGQSLSQQGDISPVIVKSHFRAPYYDRGYPAFQGRTLTPTGPLERHSEALLANASKAPLQIRKGNSINLTLRAERFKNRPYVIITSATNSYIPIDFRWIRLGWDSLAASVLQGTLPAVFKSYRGTLDAKGHGRATLTIPSNTPLVGRKIFTSFIVLDPRAPSSMGMISNRVEVRILK